MSFGTERDLGKSSGSVMLRTIHRLVSRQSTPPTRADIRGSSFSDVPRLQTALSMSQSWIQQSQHLTSHYVTDQLIDAYFLLYNTSYPILHEGSFRQKYKEEDTLPELSS